LLGELQHGTYDDECENLTEEEVNTFYDRDFDEDGESPVVDEDMGQSEAQDSDEFDDGHSEEVEDVVIDPEDGFHAEVCHFIKSLT
jgi:hypothetical protein